MKTKTKALALILSAVLLVVTTVFTTMAFLTSKDSVTNTFTVGKVEISLDEAPVDLYGETVEGNRVKTNEYKLIPGHEYTKDPTVHVANGSEDCWLFVKVENGLVNAEAAENKIADQMTGKGWTLVTGTTDIYSYREKVSAGENVVVFETFTVAGTAEVADYEDAEIVITAYAIQADGFDTAADAWTSAGSEAQGN